MALGTRILLLLTAWCFVEVTGHGAMVKPLSWFDFKQTIVTALKGASMYDYVGMKSGLQCFAGCAIPSNVICTKETPCDGPVATPGCACLWFTNYTFVTRPTLFDPRLRTYEHVTPPEEVLFNPWRAPGSAKIDSPCGIAGGNINGCIGGPCKTSHSFGNGPDALKVPFPYSFVVTNWTRGEVVEVAWGIVANHGGGYSYRLCKIPKGGGVEGLTEQCFQNTPLEFVGDKQWIQYGEDERTKVVIKATRTSKGTFPSESQWTKNPIPACIGGYGGLYYPKDDCPKGTQFKPPKSDLFGYGANAVNSTSKLFQFSIVDKVRIPTNLKQGGYVLSFRWDAEQTPQVWNTCASINIH